MRVWLILLTTCFGGPLAAQVNWFTPGDFTVTCALSQECVVNEACRPINKEITITHSRSTGAQFILPDGTRTAGVLGVLSHDGFQTMAATTSADAKRMYRINIFPDGSLTMGVANYIDRPEDALVYGSCNAAVG